jgi:adenylate cyclase
MNRGAFDFITKPIDFEDLALTLARTLAHLDAARAARRQQAEAERARANLARYFSPNLASHLAEHPDILELGGERRDLSFLFTDLADFTPLAESLDAQVIVQVMNDYISGVARTVFAHGGTVHTVVGDAVNAMFGAPLEHPDHAARAVGCALAIDAFAEAFAAARRAEGLAVGVTRIGVNSGPAIVGNVGGDSFFHYTAYGDPINAAARLERANKMLGTRICVSADTVERTPGFVGRPVGTLLVRGKDKGIESFEPLNGAGRASPAAASYLRAFRRLQVGDPRATQAFASHVGRYGRDTLATFHLKRLLAGETGTAITLRDPTL